MHVPIMIASFFQETLKSVRAKLADFFRHQYDNYFSSSGTGAMESAVVNLTDPGDHQL